MAQAAYNPAFQVAYHLKMTLLVLMNDFMIISFQEKNLILLVHYCYKVIISDEVKQM